MFSSALRGGVRRFALVGALVALTAAATASAASAELIVSPATGIEAEAELEVRGTTVPAGTDDVTIAVCNMAAIPGKKCDIGSATPGFISEAAYTAGVTITVQRGPWANYDFTSGEPVPAGGTTTCLNSASEGDPCSVVVSFYDTTAEGPQRIGAQSKALLFQ